MDQAEQWTRRLLWVLEHALFAPAVSGAAAGALYFAYHETDIPADVFSTVAGVLGVVAGFAVSAKSIVAAFLPGDSALARAIVEKGFAQRIVDHFSWATYLATIGMIFSIVIMANRDQSGCVLASRWWIGAWAVFAGAGVGGLVGSARTLGWVVRHSIKSA